MAQENYMSLPDFESLWSSKLKPYIQTTYSAKTEHQVKVVNVTESGTQVESPSTGVELGVIYVNTASSAVAVTIEASNTVKTPNGQNISINIPVGGYGEANFLNIGGTIYARGV